MPQDTRAILDSFFERAKQRTLKVVLPEGQDPRILTAARRLKDEKIAEPIVLGQPSEVSAAAAQAELSLDGIPTIDSRENSHLERYVDAYIQRRPLKESIARRMVRKPLIFAGMMVASGDAETMVAGVSSATANVIQAGAVTVGLAEGLETVSSFFLMVFPESEKYPPRTFIFADCAVNISPTPRQLADIALASQASATRLLGDEPRVALLSFSSQGSASHDLVDRVAEALTLVKQRDPNSMIDGEFQLDAAIVPKIASKKLKVESSVAGQANVLIFPDLNSGNIGYKLAQHMAGAQAIGPFLQGFAKPISDLSRGASVDDIVATTAILNVMA